MSEPYASLVAFWLRVMAIFLFPFFALYHIALYCILVSTCKYDDDDDDD